MAFTKINAAGIGSTETVTLDGLTVINDGSFGGNVSVGGTLTYEDVTNIDSVGLITARAGVVVGSGITLSKDGDGFFTGIVTATSFAGDGSSLTGVASTENIRTNTNATFLQNINVSGTSTIGGDVNIADKIVHIGDTNTAIRFPAADTITAETAGNERLRIKSTGQVLLGTTTEGESTLDDLTIANSGDCGITIRSGTSSNGAIGFSDGTSGADEYRGIIDYDHNGDDLKFYTNATEKVRIDSSGRLGVGVNSFHDTSTRLQLQSPGSDHTGIVITAAATSTLSYIYFGDTADKDIGRLVYENSSDSMQFWTNNAERLRITSAGHLSFGASDITKTWSLGKAMHFGVSENVLWGEGDYAFHMMQNAYYNGGWKYTHTDQASLYSSADGKHIFYTAASGSADSAITWSERLRITSGGDIGINIASPTRGPLHIHESSSDTTNIHLTNNDSGTTSQDGLTLFMDGNSSAGIWYRENADLRIATNNSEKARITSAGYLTVSNQPAFSMYIDGYTSESANSGTQTMPFNTANTNIGGHFKTSGSDQFKFVAPVAGQYFFSLSQNHSARVDTRILKNGTTFHGGENEIPVDETDGQWHHHTLTCLMTLAVGDKVHCTTNNQDGGSTYRAWNGNTWDNFSGFLVG